MMLAFLTSIIPLLLFFYYSHTNRLSLLSLIRLCFVDDDHRVRYVSRVLALSPSSTIVFHVPFGGGSHVITANPDVVRHILKTRFSIYKKGTSYMATYGDLFGHSLFTVDGDEWKFQRQIFCPDFTSESLKSLFETMVEPEIADRLVPTLFVAAKEGRVVDLEDVFKRFALDTTFRMLLRYDPKCLLPSLPPLDFMRDYEEAFSICNRRVRALFSGVNVWKLEKLFNIGSQKRLMNDVRKIRAFATTILEQRQQNSADSKHKDALSRLRDKGTRHDLMIDIIIATILAGRDSLSHALSRFFLLLATHPRVEQEVLKEVKRIKECKESKYSQVKDMVYTHAAICEAMRLDPPFPEDMKEAAEDDVLPDGTRIRKGMRVVYSTSSMGRSERIWGKDCEEFKPERWLEWDATSDGWTFIPRDPYAYPVFNAGPRICLGKDMALMQMKHVIAGVMRRFKLVVVPGNGVGKEYRVRVEERS